MGAGSRWEETCRWHTERMGTETRQKDEKDGTDRPD